jgi:hypothetical protein
MLLETERLHSLVRRYTVASEHPFSEGLPEPVLPPIDHPVVLHPNQININAKIKTVYVVGISQGGGGEAGGIRGGGDCSTSAERRNEGCVNTY